MRVCAALQECNTSGVLWYEAIEMEPRTGKKAKLQDAVKQCEKDAYVVLAGGRYASCETMSPLAGCGTNTVAWLFVIQSVLARGQ